VYSGGQQAGAAWSWQTVCSLSESWCGEGFNGLGVQGAKVSSLPGASPPPSVSPESQQGPFFTELTLSASVSQSPFWILLSSVVYSVVVVVVCRVDQSVQGCAGLSLGWFRNIT
jgi:hypothetical protein